MAIVWTPPPGWVEETGVSIRFTAPCSCSEADGIIIGGNTYSFVDAAGTAVRTRPGSFARGAVVEALLDCENKKAYLNTPGGGAAAAITLRDWGQDYTRSVIGLIPIMHSANASSEKYASGRVTIRRANALHSGVFADVLVEDVYTASSGIMSLLTNYRNTSTAAVTGKGVRPCAFQYNGQWYCGLEYFIEVQGTMAYFYGQTNNPTGMCYVAYYHTSNGILNDEVYNSLTYSVYTGYGGLNFNGTALV